MIEIPDDIVKWLPNLTLEELKLYLVINRYTTMGQDIPLLKIPIITGFNHPDDINRGIKGLIDKELISIKTPSGDKIIWVDTALARASNRNFFSQVKPLYFEQLKEIKKANNPIAFELKITNLLLNKSVKIKRDLGKNKNLSDKNFIKKKEPKKNNSLSKDIYIYTIKGYKDISFMFHYQNHVMKHKSRAGAREDHFSFIYLSKHKDNLELATQNSSKNYHSKKTDLEGRDSFRRCPQDFDSLNRTLDKKIRKVQAQTLVAHFTDHLYSLSNGKLSLKKKWTTKQLSIAGRLLKDYREIDLMEWKEIISFFLEDDFWQDKITNLLQIENHLPKYQIQKHKMSKKAKHRNKKLSSAKIIK